MPIYITRGNYTAKAIAGMVAKPDDREKVVAALLKKAGGKLMGMYFTLGRSDFTLISEGPDEHTVVAALLAASAGGSVSNLETSTALTPKQFMAACAKAGELAQGFRSAGQG
jgi:uncharacterized protein with GYD domain